MIGTLHDIPNREAFQPVEVVQRLPQDSQRGGIVGVTAGDGIRPCRRDLFTYPVENREADREGQPGLIPIELRLQPVQQSGSVRVRDDGQCVCPGTQRGNAAAHEYGIGGDCAQDQAKQNGCRYDGGGRCAASLEVRRGRMRTVPPSSVSSRKTRSGVRRCAARS